MRLRAGRGAKGFLRLCMLARGQQVDDNRRTQRRSPASGPPIGMLETEEELEARMVIPCPPLRPVCGRVWAMAAAAR
jgi:hypothetical protein